MAGKSKIKGRSLGVVPIVGSASFNEPWYLAIGVLIVNWANNESVFLAMLQILIASADKSSSIIWHSHRTTRARLELVERLCREQLREKNEDLLKDIQKAMSQFVAYSRLRNFYCHALYNYDDQLRLAVATGATMPQDGDPIVHQERPFDRASMNDIANTIQSLVLFNRELWKLVERLQTALGVKLVDPPRLPPVSSGPLDAHPHQETDETHEDRQ